jgi:hypothetical protein
MLCDVLDSRITVRRGAPSLVTQAVHFNFKSCARKSVALRRVRVLAWFRGGPYRLSAGVAILLVSILVVSETLSEHAEYFVAKAGM